MLLSGGFYLCDRAHVLSCVVNHSGLPGLLVALKSRADYKQINQWSKWFTHPNPDDGNYRIFISFKGRLCQIRNSWLGSRFSLVGYSGPREVTELSADSIGHDEPADLRRLTGLVNKIRPALRPVDTKNDTDTKIQLTISGQNNQLWGRGHHVQVHPQ